MSVTNLTRHCTDSAGLRELLLAKTLMDKNLYVLYFTRFLFYMTFSNQQYKLKYSYWFTKSHLLQFNSRPNMKLHLPFYVSKRLDIKRYSLHAEYDHLNIVTQ